jgi:Polysaccharide biosynthesis enzyme WcbI
MTTVCILGNCQAQHLEAMLATTRNDLKILRLDPVFAMTNDHHGPVYEKLAAADLVFAQRISDEYKMDWLSSAAIRAQFGGKVVVWPNIYFDGFFPGIGYIYLAGWGKLLSPLLEYHFTPLLNAFKAGKSVAEAVEQFAGGGIFATWHDPFEMSLDQLRAREADTDVAISDFIGEQMRTERHFYTPNHPENSLLGEMLRRLMAATGMSGDVAAGVAMPYRLDEVYIAASPGVVARYGLPFDTQTRYRRDVDRAGWSQGVRAYRPDGRVLPAVRPGFRPELNRCNESDSAGFS